MTGASRFSGNLASAMGSPVWSRTVQLWLLPGMPSRRTQRLPEAEKLIVLTGG
jgi:hypothetical protein